MNPSILWNAAKAVLKGKIIARTAALKKVKAQNLSKLEEKLRDLVEVHSANTEPSIIYQIRTVRQEIDKILGEEVEKNMRFMKQRYYEAGSKATKLLAWRLRKQLAENTIHKIRDPATNTFTSSLDGIQKAFAKYYKSLYSQSDQVKRHTNAEFFNTLDLPTLGKEINDKLISSITKEEIDKAISNLNSNKSPGTDQVSPQSGTNP